MDISTTSYVQIYTHLKAYEPHAKKTLKKQEQSIVDPLAYVAHTTSAPALPSPSTSNCLTESFREKKAPGNVGKQVARGKKVICYNCRGEGHVARQCKEPKRAKDSQYFKDKMLLMEAKEKGATLDAEAEAFLADVECTAPYDQPLAMTTTNIFEVNHEDAYDSDVDEGPNAAAAFMANLSSTSATNSQVNEVHSNDNEIFDNVNDQMSQEMHQDEHSDFNAENEIDENTISYDQYLLDKEAQRVPTEISADTSIKISNDCHLLQCKQEICRLDTQKVKLDLENKVRQEQALVIQRNKRNAELEQENVLLKSALSVKDKSITLLQSEKEKILSEKKELADSYLDEIKPIKATDDLHKDILGTRNPGLEVLVHQVVSMKKMNEKPGHVRPENGFYEKLNALKFVPQQELSREQAYWLPANEIASQASNPDRLVTPFIHTRPPPSQVLANLQKFVEQQLVPFYEHFKKHIQSANETIFREVKEYEQVFDDLDTEYERCVLDNKNLTIEKKNLLIKNDCLIAECLEKDICSIMLTSDIVVPPSSNCLCKDLRSACDREYSKVLELAPEVLKQQKMVIEYEKRNSHLQKTHIDLQLKFQNYKQCIDTSSASNANFEINKLRKQLQGKDDTIRNLDAKISGCHDDTGISTSGIAQFLGHRLDAVLKSSGCDLNYETMDLRSTKFRCIVTIKVLLLYAVIVFNTRALQATLISFTTSSKSRSKGRTVADSIAERLTRPTAYKVKTDCSIIPVWLRQQLQGKDDTIRNLDAQINIMKVLNVGSTEGSCDQQALETDRIQLKDTITSLRIQLDGLKVENVSLKRRYDELSKANIHSRTAYTEKINALTAEIAKLKTELSGKKSGGPSTSEKPKVLASGIYNVGSKYIPPPKRANWVKPSPLPKKKQVTFQEPPRTSNRPTQKPPVQQNKKPNVSVNLSTRTKPATESRKPMPKSHTRNHHILPNKSVNARRAAYHNRKLNVVDHNQFVIRSLKSVNTKTPQAKHSVNHTKQVWKATRNHNVNTTKEIAMRPARKVLVVINASVCNPLTTFLALYITVL
ncbi:retrovirus-related pol polyprotein from transposon TNT 1-94 [Tanacetum coccineum]